MNRRFFIKVRLLICGVLVFMLSFAGAKAHSNKTIAVVPMPLKMDIGQGSFVLAADTNIVANDQSRQTAEYLAGRLRTGTKYECKVSTDNAGAIAKNGSIVLTRKNSNTELGKEGYQLSVTPTSVTISASDEAGLFYGVQTLLQLFPVEIFGKSNPSATPATWTIPCVEIEDQPRFKWRGFMLDVSRHFFNKKEVEQILDLMSMHKLNTFHWHLVDDQGWRIEIKKYPRLTEVGAWRKSINFGLDPKSSTAYGADGRYGGFYTQEDIKEIVAFAASRHIDVVPEIEMPGHSTAAMMAYPELSCIKGPFSTDMDGGVFHGVYCAGNEKAFEFLEDVLQEVTALFPGQYIHIGGDEVPKDNWSKCPKCQARMKNEHLENEHELQSYFIRRIEKFVNSKGRTVIGWSEIREGGLAENATLMDWIGGAAEAARSKHDAIMSPASHCYLDHYQSHNHEEPHAQRGFLPLRKAYNFEPIPKNLESEFQSHILGAQNNLWTEFIGSMDHLQYMTFPRLTALSEVVWSPKQTRSWHDFIRRLRVHCRRLDELAVNYRRRSVE